MKELEYEPRICESCSSSSLEELWSYAYIASGKSDRYRFNVRNVICRECGFIFVSPAATRESLARYYSDTFPLWEDMKPDFNVQTRLDFMGRHIRGKECIVEIGSDKLCEFQIRLRDYFSRVITMDVNQNARSDHHEMSALPKAGADMVVHYFVLEHVTHLNKFLDNCAGLLKPGGVMVCEMPDLEKYPDDPSGLTVYEHTNHFSAGMLERIARKSGFSLLESAARECSRPFGFSAAFVKSGYSVGNIDSRYAVNKALFLRGIEKAEFFRKCFDRSWERLHVLLAKGRRIVFWAANECLSRFLEGHEMPSGVTVIDSNPAKKSFSQRFEIRLPSEAAGEIRASDAVFIFSKIHADDILAMVGRDFGKCWEPDNVVVVSDLP